ncbi:MAG: glycosyltransferase family 39 protein [Bacteroidales bacterium]|nr:glycosyltransferase family 39 protein [Bacteroidales bacterium]
MFFIPFLGGVHLFDWDEINFAEISREMIVSGDYLQVQMNFEPFWEKPPLFFWLQVVSMKLFGINEFAARFPNAIIGIITLLVIYNIGSKLFNAKFGFIWAMVYFGSLLPHLYFKSGIIVPLFNLLFFSGLYFIILTKWKNDDIENISLKSSKALYLITGGIFIGLAILTKGPVAFLIVFLVLLIYLISKKLKLFISIRQFLLFLITALFVVMIWFGIEIMMHGTWLVEEFIRYQVRLLSTPDAGHGGFPGYHIIVLLFGCFPASVFAIRGFYKLQPEKHFQKDFRKWMIILFWVVVVLFSIVQSKIVHYSSLAYFPLTFLASLTILEIIGGKIKFSKGLKFGLTSIAILFGVITFAIPFLGRNIETIKPFFENDPFTFACLEAKVNWTGWESTAGIYFIIMAFVAVFQLNRSRLIAGFRILFFGTAVFLFLWLILFIGKIEMYTQNANIEFCESLQGKNCYVITSGFKSYGQYFYTRTQPHTNGKSNDIGWLIWEKVDKEVYIISKIDLTDYWRGVHTVIEIGGRNGFMFYKRKEQK